MDLLLHFKVNEGDENNINIQEYMLYGDVETKSEKCLVDEGDEVVLTEFPVPEFKNCTLMKKGDEGFCEYKDYRQGENAELAGGYAVSGILQQNKRFDFNYVNDQINGIVQNLFIKLRQWVIIKFLCEYLMHTMICMWRHLQQLNIYTIYMIVMMC